LADISTSDLTIRRMWKKRLFQSLHNRASTISQKWQDLVNEVINLRRDLQLNGYPHGYINSGINSKGSSCRDKQAKWLGSLYIPYVKDIPEKLKYIGNRYTIRTIFETKHTLRCSRTRTTPERDPKQTAHCVYTISCECGRSYSGKTCRPLTVRLCKHRHNLREGLLEKSKLAQHAYEEGTG
jgi:hypothetical protein